MASQCVILVGGLGSRLGDRSKTTPKPLLDVGGAPFLETLFGEARRRGFDDFLLLAGYRSEAFVDFLAERDIESRFGCRVELSIEPTLLGTGGALVRAMPLLHEDFLLLNGDSWFDFNWLDFVLRGRRDRACAALALRGIAEPHRYETVELDGSFVRAIRPRDPMLASGLINGGAYYVTRQAVEGSAAPSSLEREILPRLARRGVLRGYSYRGFFIDIGVPESLTAAAELVPPQRRRPAVFLDRDGVLNVGRGHVRAPDRLEWISGAKEGIKLINDAGYYVFIVINRASLARRHDPEETITALRRWMERELAVAGASIDDLSFYQSHPKGSAQFRAACDRAPSDSRMLLDLFADWPIEREGSFLVGDKASDILAVKAAGVPGYLFQGGDLAAFLRRRLRPRANLDCCETLGGRGSN